MANDGDMSGWMELLHSSAKLSEQAAPSAQFPPLQRNLDQLEALSKKLKAKTLRAETPTQSIAATRLLAREGINAEQLARDLKSFELKTTFEDVFPSEATTVEEYLQQVHEMAMVSSIQEAQKDNLRSFNEYMMQVLEDDWQKEKRDFLRSLSCLSSLPRTNSSLTSSGISHMGQLPSLASSLQISTGPSNMEVIPNKPIIEKKASVYAEIVKNLNDARGRGLPFKPAAAFRGAYEVLGLDVSGGKSVSMQKIWHLIQMLVGEDSTVQRNISRKMSLVMGARKHLEWGHEKYILDTIQSHPAQAALGGAVGNLQKIRAFLRVRLRDHGMLDFDAGDARRRPPIDTTWQQAILASAFARGDQRKIVAATSRVLQLSIVLGVVLALVLGVGMEFGSRIFTKDASVLQIVHKGLPFVAATQPINSLAFVFDGVNFGASDYTFAAYSMVAVAAVSIPCLIFLSSSHGFIGIWIALTIYMTLRTLASIWRMGAARGPWTFLRK